MKKLVKERVNLAKNKMSRVRQKAAVALATAATMFSVPEIGRAHV